MEEEAEGRVPVKSGPSLLFSFACINTEAWSVTGDTRLSVPLLCPRRLGLGLHLSEPRAPGLKDGTDTFYLSGPGADRSKEK